MLLNIPQCTGKFPITRMPWSTMAILLRLRNSTGKTGLSLSAGPGAASTDNTATCASAELGVFGDFLSRRQRGVTAQFQGQKGYSKLKSIQTGCQGLRSDGLEAGIGRKSQATEISEHQALDIRVWGRFVAV